MNDVTIRRLDRSELQQLAEMCLQEGWNHPLSYLRCCYDLDPDGWRAAVVEGRIVGACACLKVPDDHERARVGTFIVDKPYRSQGIGAKLLRASLQGMAARNMILTTQNPSLYKNKSFQRSFAINQWKLKRARFCPKLDVRPTVRIIGVDELSFAKVEAYDKKATPWNSAVFLKEVMFRSASSAFVAVDNTTDDVIGYGCLRRGPTDLECTIQPLYACSRDAAHQLLKSLLAGVKERDNVTLYPCADNGEAVSLMKKWSFVQHEKPWFVMVTREYPVTSVDKMFSIGNLDAATI